jgi:hypothetical protein
LEEFEALKNALPAAPEAPAEGAAAGEAATTGPAPQ